MPKKKCPACGAADTIKILYGMPTHEAFEASERGELVLGGCYVSDANPARHCKVCKQNFGGRYLFHLLEMNSFEFSVGGYFGTSHSIFINGKRKNKVIRYAKTPGGMFVDLKHPRSEINRHPEVLFKEIPLTLGQWLDFIEELTSLEIAFWKDKYYENNICDGTQWELVIRFPHRNKISKCGSNEYPPYWNKLIKIMKKYIGENID
jgi:hypothetical protein